MQVNGAITVRTPVLFQTLAIGVFLFGHWRLRGIPLANPVNGA
jgi:hypothetical protein